MALFQAERDKWCSVTEICIMYNNITSICISILQYDYACIAVMIVFLLFYFTFYTIPCIQYIFNCMDQFERIGYLVTGENDSYLMQVSLKAFIEYENNVMSWRLCNTFCCPSDGKVEQGLFYCTLRSEMSCYIGAAGFLCLCPDCRSILQDGHLFVW